MMTHIERIEAKTAYQQSGIRRAAAARSDKDDFDLLRTASGCISMPVLSLQRMKSVGFSSKSTGLTTRSQNMNVQRGNMMKPALYARIAMTVFAVCGALSQTIAAGAQGQAAAPPLGPEAQMHVTAAMLLAQKDSPIVKYACPGQPALTQHDPRMGQDPVAAPPTKIFDQLYYFGTDFVGSYALVTSDGIIAFDTMDNSEEAEKIIVGGYKAVGLDPAKIKYIVISHGHGDHYGGALYLQEKYHPHILMGPLDWDMMAKATAAAATKPPVDRGPHFVNFGPPPQHDMDVSDGQKLTLGNTTVTLYRTPGHTPDTLSAIFQVTDHGVPHVVTWVGGTLPPNAAGSLQMEQSYERLLQIGLAANSDVLINPHPYAGGDFSILDKDISKIDKLQNRKPGEPNPFVIGRDKYIRYMMAHLECVEAKAAYAEGK
jgi:metallo-beta-lactamase class B